MQLRDKLKHAKEIVPTISTLDAFSKVNSDKFVFVDVRDLPELEKDGTIPGSVHAPRGSLEFALDPRSAAYKMQFGANATFIVFCASGMRSLLAGQTMTEMGIKNVVSLQGGYIGWCRDGGPSSQGL